MDDPLPIHFQAAGKVYRDFFLRQKVAALSDLNLSIRRGEIVGLLGPNGSGKSTAIRLLTGLARPSSGAVRLLGLDPRMPSARRSLGYLPEENANYPGISARKLATFHGRLAGLSKRDAKRQSVELLERLGLARAADRASGTFSKGMARRLGLAQCLMGDPEVLVLDEPTSGLDPVATELVRELLQELRARGKTVLLSSHLLAEIEDVCDRIVVLSHGVMVCEGKTEDLLAIPDQLEMRVVLASRNPDEARQTLARTGFEVVRSASPRRTLSQFYRETVREPEQ